MHSLGEEYIAEVGIDQSGVLFVQPQTQTFPFIYRAGMGVYWDTGKDRLHFPGSRAWPYPRVFKQIVQAVIGEYGVVLKTNAVTIWSNVPEDLRSDIEDIGR